MNRCPLPRAPVALIAFRCLARAGLPVVLLQTASPPHATAAEPSGSSAPPAPLAVPSVAPSLKQQLEQAGVKLDLYVTGFAQSQASGSDDSATINNLNGRGTGTGLYGGGRFDALLELDTTRLGLWRGGQILAHGEVEGGALPGWRGGAFWPVNIGAILPLVSPQQWSLTSLYLRQRWGGTTLMAGKINVMDLQAQNPFFGGWGIERFWNLALALPPTGVTPVSLMAGSVSQRIGEVSLSAMVYDPSDRTAASLDKLFANGANISLGAQWNGRLWQRPSNLGVTYNWSTRQSVSLSEIYVPSQLRQLALRSPNNLTVSYGHQIWPSAVRPGKGIGVYGRVGVTAGDPNPIQSSLAMGISGEGMLRSRPWDGFGFGVFRTNWSDGLSTALLTPVQSEMGVEAFYNIALTPWLSLTPDVQVIRPASVGSPVVTVVGLRSRLRF